MTIKITRRLGVGVNPTSKPLSTSAKLLGLALSAAVLGACTGGEVTDSSSSEVTQSSAPISSSSVASSASSVGSSFDGDAAQGLTKFAAQCAACHTVNGDGTFGANNFYFEVNAFAYPNTTSYQNSIEGLTDYIFDRMPKLIAEPTTCTVDCADDIAAYLWELRTPTTSSEASSSSEPAAVSTQFGDFTPNIADGATAYEQMCVSCHGDEGAGDGLTQLEIKLDNYPTNGILHSYIEANMPKKSDITGGPSTCVGQCAADLTALMDTWRAPIVAACSADDPVIYSERSLKLMTSSEYRNTIQDLFPTAEVPSELLATIQDIKIGRFPNHFDTAVVSNRAREFMRNAEGIADWALENNMLPACENATTCAATFIDDFAYRAFRRPLKTGPSADENEVAQMQELFAQAPNARTGLRWAVIATLTSPNFLYRSEMGIKVSEALANGWNTGGGAGTGDAADYIADGAGVTVNGADFATKGSGEALPGFGYNMYTNGTSSQQFNFPDPALLSITVKANDMDMVWPEMQLSVGQTAVATEMVASYDQVTYVYLVTGQSGNQNVSIQFANDGGREPYGTPGNDIDLHIGDVNVAPAKLKEADNATDTRSALEKADPDAYVLDPYEYAAAISYTYTGSTPDALLMAAARSGAINDPAVVEQHIERLLESDGVERRMKEFAETWMRVDNMYTAGFHRDGADFDESIRDAMVEELRTTFWNVFDNEDVPFSEIYSADYVFANKALADFYGLPFNGGNADEFAKIGTTERGGLATMGAFLANWAHPDQSAPILRAVGVREQFLCHHIDPPPKTAVDERAELTEKVNMLLSDGTMTTRRYYGLITDDKDCNSCHEHDINPLGFGLEDFDQNGLPRTTQMDLGAKGQVLDIDSNGVLFGTEIFKDIGTAVDFNGAKALSKVLAETNAVQECLSEKMFRMAVGRPTKPTARDQLTGERELSDSEVQDYACATQTLNNALQQSNQSPKALLKTLGTLDLIRFRR